MHLAECIRLPVLAFEVENIDREAHILEHWVVLYPLGKRAVVIEKNVLRH